VDVVGAHVGERPDPLVLELDPREPPWAGRDTGMAAGERLELRLFVCADDVVVGAEPDTVDAAGVEVQDAGRLRGELRVAGEDPRPIAPRLERVGVQPATHRR